MPAPVSMTVITGRLAVGLTAAALDAFDCQVVTAALVANANLNTVPATFCAAESQQPAATGWQLDLNFLQDWTDPDGVCWFAFDNDTKLVYWELSLDTGAVADEPVMNGTAYVVALQFGGDAGTPLQSSTTWPVPVKPTKGAAAPAAAAVVGQTTEVDTAGAEQPVSA